jgi:protocatechuate 3,4-dioxygenase beta subunit
MGRQTLLASLFVAAVVNAQSPSLVPSAYLAAKYLAGPEAPSTIVLAGPDEPGERLVVTGRVMYGTTPVVGASVFVFQTDSQGFYAPGRKGPDAELDPRLHGALRSGAEGQYQVETIRPGSYNDNPAHLHYVVVARGFKPRIFDLWFQDDPILVARLQVGEPLIQQSMRNSPFYKAAPDSIAIRPVLRDAAGTWQVVRDLDMVPE